MPTISVPLSRIPPRNRSSYSAQQPHTLLPAYTPVDLLLLRLQTLLLLLRLNTWRPTPAHPTAIGRYRFSRSSWGCRFVFTSFWHACENKQMRKTTDEATICSSGRTELGGTWLHIGPSASTTGVCCGTSSLKGHQLAAW